MQYEKEHHAGDCRFQTVLLRKISDMEGKFASQMSKLQQQGELHLARAVALAKDAAMAEFSPIVKGVSEVLHSQLRRMDHLEAQWRLLEKRCEEMGEPPAVTLEGEMLQISTRLADLEGRTGIVSLYSRAGELEKVPDLTGKQHELEISISSIAQKTELLEQDGRELRQRLEEIQERSKCLKAWQEAKEEQNREFLERFERINVETQLKTLQLKLQEVLKSAQQQQEFAEVLEKRIESQEFEAAHRLERFDSRRSMRQESVQQRVDAAEQRIEACCTSLETVNSCLMSLEQAVCRDFPSGESTPPNKPRPMSSSPETETLRARASRHE
ncbi:unnamed protein product [Durusdinium trenchii]|uniref:Uncharacterized protein n=1 Tax=Durusdinium trenchii TaxID=1381693 RepID=A0ABP0L0U9_9DINO